MSKGKGKGTGPTRNVKSSPVGRLSTVDGNPAERTAPARKVAHLTPEERSARGKAARNEVSRSSHGRGVPAENRPDPIALLQEQAASRVPELVPIAMAGCWSRPSRFAGVRR
jgi:hypothetical protein